MILFKFVFCILVFKCLIINMYEYCFDVDVLCICLCFMYVYLIKKSR